MKIILLCTVIISFVFFVSILCFIKRKYSHIHEDMRLIGFIANKLIDFKDKKGLIRLSRHTPSLPNKLHKDIRKNVIWIKTKFGHNLRLLILSHKAHVSNATTVLWLHGGGYAIQKPENDLGLMQKFVEHNGAVVIAPDYTLSVIEPYPRGLEDCYEALLWVKENAQTFGANKNQIFVAGGSAGGGLTASLTLLARDRKEVFIAYQMPLYPMIDYKNIASDDKKEMFIWDCKRNKIAWEVYLGKYYSNSKIPDYASPLYATDFSRLPPMYTFVGTEDPFYTETLEYVKKLQNAGVTVAYNTYEKSYHAFDSVAPFSQNAKKAWSNLLTHYDYAVEHYHSPNT